MDIVSQSTHQLAKPGSLPIRIATKARERMFGLFMHEMHPAPSDTVLDLGVTDDQSLESSNYFERLYPYPRSLTAAGIDDASFLETQYPGVTFREANALNLPFPSQSFDYVHSAAVIEHVGSLDNQTRMIREVVRVAKRGIFLTTPNRFFPIELHTVTPVLRWLPKPWHRAIYRRIGLAHHADEANLNLMSRGDLRGIIGHLGHDWQFKLSTIKLCGWPSNLLLIGHKRSIAAN